ncbi:cytochrome c oxidase subunit 3 [Stagnimonas aquatica]|uniref:cytochrome-c oxidase n=1 Tax=Stagnimonas aquatica TaxID=2689987 RepID=A0A3N0VGJ2_9GAMM|nr:cytochrome c oxidase subunit 3 [Stagnimonas aquatica]ROH91812.1 cytochrome c oxidase subunit 3 [Stagnimonas aquatica]
MSSPAPANGQSRYFVPDPSAWPFMLTAGLVTLIIGVWSSLEDKNLGALPYYLGGGFAAFIIFRWFRGIALESEGGKYSSQVDMTYRMGMAWFIFSEVMFFAAFFGALFYAREISLPWIGGEGAKGVANLLWDGFEASWPSNGPANLGGYFETVSAWGLPFINTCLLLSSGVTITFAHHALKDNKRLACILWMWATVAFGVVFLYCQAVEYIHAYHALNLTLHSGVYGSTFFMLTGFHGMHVTLGTLMLIVITIRLMLGHFKPDSHFGFEGVAWYWHFVDVVWIGLFVFVYVL